MAPVKPHPPARSARRDRARATRRRILHAAHALFCDWGYTGTTMAHIAEAAGVAIQTVYFAFHTKSDVLQAAYELAVLGEGDPTPPELQAWYVNAVAEPDVTKAVRSFVDGAGGIIRRVALLDMVVRTAAETDPDAAQFIQHSDQLRVDGYRALLDQLAAKSELRAGLSPEHATDVTLLLVGPAAYRALVEDGAWSHAEWVAWTTTAMVEQVFGIPAGGTDREVGGT